MTNATDGLMKIIAKNTNNFETLKYVFSKSSNQEDTLLEDPEKDDASIAWIECKIEDQKPFEVDENKQKLTLKKILKQQGKNKECNI